MLHTVLYNALITPLYCTLQLWTRLHQQPHKPRMSSHPLPLSLLLPTLLMAASVHATSPSHPPPPPPPLAPRESYRAGVVEYTPNITFDFLHIPTRDEAVHYMMYNLLSYEKSLRWMRENGVQIVVFPENGIYGFWYSTRDQLYPFLEDIPDPALESVVPCGNPAFADRPILAHLSCLARDYGVVLVANMGDKKVCSNSSGTGCPPNGWYHYNTNVAFDSDGLLLARYHKTHLFVGEKKVFDTPHPTQHITFKTSFGVTFGTFTCYDILFCDPPLALLRKGIRNFVFLTAWGNSYPFYTSVAVQQGWSLRTGTNLLAANIHLPNKASLPVDINFYLTGSGIYSQGKKLASFISGENFPPATGKAVVATLDKDPTLNFSDFEDDTTLIIAQPNESLREREGVRNGVGESSPNADERRKERREERREEERRREERREEERREEERREERREEELDELTADHSIDMHNNTYLNFTALKIAPQGEVRVTYTNSDPSLTITCILNYSVDHTTLDHSFLYAFGAYTGPSKDDPLFLFSVCALVQCATAALDSCGEPVPNYHAEMVFERIQLSGDFPEGSGPLFSAVLLDGLELVSPSYVELGERSLVVEGVSDPLLSASLWSRVGSQATCEDHCPNQQCIP